MCPYIQTIQVLKGSQWGLLEGFLSYLFGFCLPFGFLRSPESTIRQCSVFDSGHGQQICSCICRNCEDVHEAAKCRRLTSARCSGSSLLFRNVCLYGTLCVAASLACRTKQNKSFQAYMGFEPLFVVSPIIKTYLLGLYKPLLLSD